MPFKDYLAEKTDKILEKIETKRDLLENPDKLLDLQWEALSKIDAHGLRYVLDENCLVLSPTLATVFDMERAIIIQQIHFFVCINRERQEESCYRKHGHHWMYCTPKKWRETLPFISPSTFKRKMRELAQSGIVIRYQSHKDDYITLYRIDYKKLETLLNNFTPEEQSFKLGNLDYLLLPAKYDKKTSVIMRDTPKI